MSEFGNVEFGADRRSQQDSIINRVMTTAFATLCVFVTTARLALLLWGPTLFIEVDPENWTGG